MKAICIFSLFCFIQQVNYTKTAPVDNDYNYKEIIQIINEDTLKIAKYEENSKHVVSTAKDSINESFEQLRQFIEESRIEALSIGANIDECLIETTAVDYSIIDDIEKCRTQDEVAELKKELAEITKVVASLSSVIDVCKSNSKLYNVDCPNDEMNAIIRNVTLFDTRVDSVLSNASIVSFQCVQSTLLRLDKNIDVVAHDFMGCIDENVY